MSTKEASAPSLFHQGINYKAYEYMGCHAGARQGETGKKRATYVFRVWAPHATEVYVTGDFNGWSKTAPMRRITDGGIWETELDAELFAESRLYKYRILSAHGEFLKADPYGAFSELPPAAASLVGEVPSYGWRDRGWMKYRRDTMANAFYAHPINIYEVHLGSWKRREDGSFYTYTEIAPELACYVKQMGYTHVALLPVTEHPFGGVCGCRINGYYAPTACYGTPEELMQFVDTMHEAGIGVILNWSPLCFPIDAHGLYEFDGEPLYESHGDDCAEIRERGCRFFDVRKNEVQSFLISNAVYWAECYHVDGLRLKDASESREVVAFFGKLSAFMSKQYPDVLMISESENFLAEGVANESCLSLVCNKNRMRDMLAYATLESIDQKCNYNYSSKNGGDLISLCERGLLCVSHNDVVRGKKSLLDRMPGEYWQKFANTRAFLGYMMTHPGKKLMFMGCEIGQFREWDCRDPVEWFLLDYVAHARLQLFFAEVNHFYLEHPALWEDELCLDFEGSPYDDREKRVLSYRRVAKSGEELTVVINFTSTIYRDYEIGVSEAGDYLELLNSDDIAFGGNGIKNDKPIRAEEKRFHEYDHVIRITVPPLSACIFQRRENKRVPEDTIIETVSH